MKAPDCCATMRAVHDAEAIVGKETRALGGVGVVWDFVDVLRGRVLVGNVLFCPWCGTPLPLPEVLP